MDVIKNTLIFDSSNQNNMTTTHEKITKVTVSQLEAMLQAITKSTVCNVIYIVDHAQSKTIAGQKQLQKMVQCKNVYLNHSYENKVKNLTGDTTFEAQPLKGKTRICGTLLRSDKTGETMIDGKILKSETVTLLALLHKGEFVSESDAILMGLFTDAYFNPTPKNTMGRGTVETEDDFAIINTYLSRIFQIKLQGEWYEVKK